MKKLLFLGSLLFSCSLFAVSTPVPKISPKLSRNALIDLVPRPGDIHSSESENKADFSKKMFIDLISQAKHRILNDPSMKDCSQISFQSMKDVLSESDCQVLDECAELYYKEKPKNSIDFGYRFSEELETHYRDACFKEGVEPETLFSERLFFEILVEAAKSSITYEDFVRMGSYRFSPFGQSEQDRKEAAEARKAEAEAKRAEARAEAEARRADRIAEAEARKAQAEAEKAQAEADRAKGGWG